MSILDRLLGGESTDDESCCDMQIEEVDPDKNEADMLDEGTDNRGD
jgi:hypothetical protein